MNCKKITLRDARMLNGYTLKDVANYANISINSLIRYERDSGNMPYETLAKILKLYQLPFKYIYIGRNTKQNQRNDVIPLMIPKIM